MKKWEGGSADTLGSELRYQGRNVRVEGIEIDDRDTRTTHYPGSPEAGWNPVGYRCKDGRAGRTGQVREYIVITVARSRDVRFVEIGTLELIDVLPAADVNPIHGEGITLLEDR